MSNKIHIYMTQNVYFNSLKVWFCTFKKRNLISVSLLNEIFLQVKSFTIIIQFRAAIDNLTFMMRKVRLHFFTVHEQLNANVWHKSVCFSTNSRMHSSCMVLQN